jgi:hypothetical protein
MKQIHIVFVISMSFLGLNAMSDVPNVTKWQEICKNPEEKQQLLTVYKDFCHERVKHDAAWTVGSLTPFMIKSVRKSLPIFALFGSFSLYQTYLLGRNVHRNQLAKKDDLSYLNHDVLEQLGNPEMDPYGYFDVENAASYYNRKYAGRLLEIERRSECLSVDNIVGIKKALSESWRPTSYPDFSSPKVQIKNKIQQIKQRIKDTIQ